MTRIAYLASEYPAPSHTFIRREIAALREAGLDIVTFSIRPPHGEAASELERAARAETRAVLGRPAFAYLAATLSATASRPARTLKTLGLALRHRGPGGRALVWAVFHFIEAMLLARLLRNAAATRLHCHFANSGATVGMLAAHLLGIPWSLTLHGVSETDYPAGLLLADKVGRSDFVACASWFMRAQAMRVSSPRDWHKLHVVRCGIDLAAIPSPRRHDDGIIRLVCVGRLSSEKGQRGLLEAFALLHRQVAGSRLDLVGDGPLRQELAALTDALELTGAVRFHGALPEAETLSVIADADILVLPSFMEGLPLVLIEAMALGKPVVSSAVAGIPELVRHGENGLLVPASHWRALADAMATLCSDPELRDRFGAAGRRSVADAFDITLAVRPLAALFSHETR